MASGKAGSRNQVITNAPSSLLSKDENDQLFNIIGNKCVTLCSAVVQVYRAEAPSYNAWTKRYVGVATLIKDSSKRSFYIRVFDIKNMVMLWEQEMYDNFKYMDPKPHFHTFEAHDCQTGLNFASESEARIFADAVQGETVRKLERSRRKTEKLKSVRHNNNVPAANVRQPAAAPNQPYQNARPITSQNSSSNLQASSSSTNLADRNGVKKPMKGGKGRPKLTKDDIGQPMDFRHVNHVGWDPEKGFDMNELDDDLKSVFQLAGVTEDAMQDEETRKMVYGIIEEQGGLAAVREQVRARPQPAPVIPSYPMSAASSPPSRPLPALPMEPAASAPPPPTRGYAAASVVPPPHLTHANTTAPPPPSLPPRGPGGRTGTAPPPPPAQQHKGPPARAPAAPPPPPPPSQTGLPPPPSWGVGAPPPPSGGFGAPLPSGGFGAPPPPPPPPPPVPTNIGSAPPPPPPPVLGLGAPRATPAGGGGERSALLGQIQSGAALKKVTPSEAPVVAVADDRNALLNAIRLGTKLNKVDDLPVSPTGSSPGAIGGGGSIIGALQMALASRQKQLQGSDDEADMDDDVDDDDDWDED